MQKNSHSQISLMKKSRKSKTLTFNPKTNEFIKKVSQNISSAFLPAKEYIFSNFNIEKFKSKELLNGIYGMSVQNPAKGSILFNDCLYEDDTSKTEAELLEIAAGK